MEDNIKIKIEEYIKNANNMIYAPIPHPLFSNIKAIHDGRSSIIVDKIKKRDDLFTGLDIGSHWGEMCYVLEDNGIEMTAIESYKVAFDILTALRDDCNRQFKTIYGDVLNLSEIKYDIIIATNIFHHFLKTKEKYDKWLKMLSRIDCKIMFFQSHNIKETQMKNAYKNFNPEEFIEKILQNSCLNNYELILNINRPIYMLSK